MVGFVLIKDAGLPHEVNQDDVYQGYLIPKGTMVFYNLWYVPCRIVFPQCSQQVVTFLSGL